MKHVYGWLLLTPAAILLVGFTHYPAAATLFDSFFSTGTVVRPSRFVGLGNYASLAEDPIFWQVLGNNFWFALGTIPTAIALAMVMALWVNQKLPARALVRMAYFTPTVLPMIAQRFFDTTCAATLTVVLLLMLAALAVLQFLLIERRVHYR